MRTPFLICAAAAIVLATAAPAAAQGTAFGGGVVSEGVIGSTSIALLVQPDGSVTGRVGLGQRCGKTSYVNTVVRLKGTAANGALSVTGSTKLTRRGRLKLTLTGTVAGEQISGDIKRSTSRIRCQVATVPFRLRAASAAAGAPAMPAANALLGGVTSQVVGGLSLPVFMQVSKTGRRVTGLWQATMQCGPKAVLTAVNFSPPASIGADGTFVKREKYRIRYARRQVDTYRVEFRGQFRADGATGTIRARMTTRQPGKRFFPCDSGVQSWSAAAAG